MYYFESAKLSFSRRAAPVVRLGSNYIQIKVNGLLFSMFYLLAETLISLVYQASVVLFGVDRRVLFGPVPINCLRTTSAAPIRLLVHSFIDKYKISHLRGPHGAAALHS